jgi:hypothetical protein
MSQSVYSTRFVASLLTTTAVTYYTVPAGKVAVVRTMSIGWSSLARLAGTFSVLLGTSNSLIWRMNYSASTVGSDKWEGNMVLPAGEILRALTTTPGTFYLTVSGFLLSVP